MLTNSGNSTPKPSPSGDSQSVEESRHEATSSPIDSIIPAAQASEIRRLVHDLSNGLEIVIQSSYLLSTSELAKDSQQWLKLLDQGVQQAASVNQELRAYILAHS